MGTHTALVAHHFLLLLSTVMVLAVTVLPVLPIAMMVREVGRLAHTCVLLCQ